MLCPAHGFNPSQARIIYAKLLQDSVTFGGLHDAIPTDSREPAENVACGVMRVFRGPEKREALKKQFENIQALLEDLARNGPELGADFELGVEPAELEPVAAQITAPSRKRVLVATVSGDNEEASGYTTPSPTKISKLSKLELFRLQLAPIKLRQR
jgi:hypothetical protein